MRGSKHSPRVHKKSREAHKEENAFKNWHHEHRCQNERYKSWEYSSLHHWGLGSRGRNVKDYKTKLTKCKKKKKKKKFKKYLWRLHISFLNFEDFFFP